MTHDILNDLLDSAKNDVLDEIRQEIEKQSYVILADEGKGLNKKEHFAVALRYVKNALVKERIIEFVKAGALNAPDIASSILDLLRPMQLEAEKCVGLGFDGASVVSGDKVGVQTILRQQFPNTIHVPCSCHPLNLVLNNVCHSVPDVKNFLELLNKLPTFMSGSKRHILFPKVQIKLDHKTKKELVHPCKTRWLS